MQDISLKDLLEAGCHFGHKVDRWHPKADAFIYQERDGIHLIDLVKTRSGLIKAAEYLKNLVSGGGTVLFVGTKRQAVSIIKEEAGRAGAAFMQKRWIGGFLTNWEQVHKNLEKIRRLTEEEKNNTWKKYPKHERVKLSRYLDKIEELYGGVVSLTDKPQALVVVDIKREMVAVREAQRMGIPIVAIVDTNSDPTGIDYVVPANDDAVGSITVLIHHLAGAYKEGADQRQKELAKEKVKTEKTEELSGAVDKAAQADKVEQAIETKVEEKPKRKTRAKKSDAAASSRTGSPSEGTPAK